MNASAQMTAQVRADARSAQWPQHKRSGVWLTDDSGREVISAFSAGGNFNFGFNSSEVRAELIDIVSTHDSGLWPYPSERRDEGERRYAVLLPEPLTRTYFVSCAAEAFEVACKLAKRITGRPGLVCATHGYHGHIGFSLAMDDEAMGPQQFAPLAGGIRRATYGSIESLADAVDATTAAVCLETIQIPAGVIVPPRGYFAAVRRLCDERGALLILDEVQAGACRTGRPWAINEHGVVPDLLIAGKGISGGVYPIGALSYAQRHHAHVVEPVLVHPSTYAGNEIGARLAGALARRYANPAFCEHVNDVGAMLAQGLDDITQRHPDLLEPEVRGRGLILAVDARSADLGGRLIVAAMNAGLLVRRSKIRPSAIVFSPPLVISAAEVDEVLNRFEAGVNMLRSGRA